MRVIEIGVAIKDSIAKVPSYIALRTQFLLADMSSPVGDISSYVRTLALPRPRYLLEQ